MPRILVFATAAVVALLLLSTAYSAYTDQQLETLHHQQQQLQHQLQALDQEAARLQRASTDPH